MSAVILDIRVIRAEAPLEIEAKIAIVNGLVPEKKSFSKSKTWMNSDGEQTEDDSDSSYPCFEVFDYLNGEGIGLAPNGSESVHQ